MRATRVFSALAAAFVLGTQAFALDVRTDILDRARALVGTPYLNGGQNPGGFDCSGLIFYLYRPFLPDIPRNSRNMAIYGTGVARDALRPGDLVFFATMGQANGISHVAIYLGNDSLVHALSDGPARGVTVTSIDARYWKTRFVSARRVLPLPTRTAERAPEPERPPVTAAQPPVPRPQPTPSTPERVVFAKGSYRGKLVDGEPQGSGTFDFTNGDRYSGEFDRGDLHGKGIYTWADGTTWEGTFTRNRAGRGAPLGHLPYPLVEDSVWESWDGDIYGDFNAWQKEQDDAFRAFRANEPPLAR